MEIKKNDRYYYDGVITCIEEFASHKQEKWVLSSHSAAALWGFDTLLMGAADITFPKGNVSKKFAKYKDDPWMRIKQRSGKLYSEGIVRIDYDGLVVLAYEPERAFVEILKDEYTKMDDVLIATIKKFYKEIQYDYEKLIKYADMFGVRELVELSQALVV